MLFYQNKTIEGYITDLDLKDGLYQALDKIGKKKKILIVPPDFTRVHSKAGLLTSYAWQYFGKRIKHILPAIGTHSPMNKQQLNQMYTDVPLGLFKKHDWRNDLFCLGKVPADFIKQVTDNIIRYDWPVEVNELLVKGKFDLILSIGQVVPHEVAGMANYNKNIFVGIGGADSINKSHFIGAAYGMEKILGQFDNPVRDVFNYASDNFAQNLPIIYILTVIAQGEDGNFLTKGLFIGDDIECFKKASMLSQCVNIEIFDSALKKIVVHLDPTEYKSTWLGNKSIYRTRMILDNNGELIIIAPGVKEFGEDAIIDRLIRKYGYMGTKKIMQILDTERELKQNLGVAAHLIHGSTEKCFTVTYCPGKLSKEEIEKVNYKYLPISHVIKKYNPNKLRDGFNMMPDGEEIFFISNPGLGLWSSREKFNIR